MHIKHIYFDKASDEIEFQNIVSTYGFCPKIHKVKKGRWYWQVYMDDIQHDCLADKYGTEIEDIPDWIWDKIRFMVQTLKEEECIEYIDITPYNFIEKNNQVYMIDFGD